MLLGREIKVKEEQASCDGVNVNGTYDHDAREIIVTPPTDFETFAHEFAHGHITFTGWDQKLNEREVELLCQLMVNYAVDLIKGLQPHENKTEAEPKRKRNSKTRK